ncbi:TadE family type IV pilus minor pilin [Streptomyces sp. NPDC017979]|uniref:TadE family type IV pilus minor pilin n=1 Tax=Streptomyces sp. NPDC017979 TaxID=3365024 RepID=UPI00378AFF3E
MGSSDQRRAARDRGAVTAEAAIAIPALVALTAALMWGLMSVATHIRCVDAAYVGARAAARSEPRATVLALARATAPAKARVTVVRAGDFWRVRVEAEAPGPGGLGLTLRAGAAALTEDGVEP